jgi:hypothetical protein
MRGQAFPHYADDYVDLALAFTSSIHFRGFRLLDFFRGQSDPTARRRSGRAAGKSYFTDGVAIPTSPRHNR